MKKWETSGITPRLPLVVPIGDEVITGRDIKSIFGYYHSRREAAGERFQPGWEQEVWQALQARYPKWVRPTHVGGTGGVTVNSALSFVRFMAKRIFDRSLVSEGEAQRRASICWQCPMREYVLGCTKCKAFLETQVSPPRHIDAPEACGACLCYLPLKVWIPREQLGPAEEFSFWEGCWMREP
jgi:hypothetical protein